MEAIKYILTLCVLFGVTNTFSQTGVFRVNGENMGNEKAVQIGYSDYRYLTFGECEGSDWCETHNNGAWSIEHWEHGLNFWRPWPLWNADNYFLFIHDFGQVGIGMRPNEDDWVNMLQLRKKVKALGYNTWSDERLKENISPLAGALQKIMQLKPVSYNYRVDIPYFEVSKDDVTETKAKTNEMQDATLDDRLKDDIRLGFLAQEINEIVPEVVDTDGDGIMAINYGDLVPLAIKAIQEQQEEINQLKAELENIKALNQLVNTPEGLGIKATLFQNDPNPFDQSTTIRYNIEDEFESAELVIYDFWANAQAKQDIHSIGEGSFTLEASTLLAGTYHYSLIINGVIVDTRIMFLVK